MKIKHNRIYRMMTYYAWLMVSLMLLLPLTAILFLYQQRKDNLLSEMALYNYHVQAKYEDATTQMRQIATRLTHSPDKIRALRNYLSKSYSEYLQQSLLNEDMGNYVPDTMSSLYGQHSGIEAVSITLDGIRTNYTSTTANKLGKKDVPFPSTTGVVLSYPLYDAKVHQTIGWVMVSFHESFFEVGKGVEGIQTVIIDTQDDRVFLQSDVADDLDGYLVSELAVNENLSVVSYAKPALLWQGTSVIIAGIMVLSITIIAILLSMLYRFFGSYSHQVSDILRATHRIEKGQLYWRIAETNKKDELQQIAQSINRMLDANQLNIKALYRLEVQHQEAQLKALQAQINPHFMYNTLEFIRMSALLEGAEELADIVYDFAVLLRNNISSEKELTIRQEVSFCQKYVNLYQIRYPNRLKVSFNVDDSCADYVIPKFSIQPLIENYLVHGVDFSREDNELSVHIYPMDASSRWCIHIQDNGKGMTAERLAFINRILNGKAPVERKESSIGVRIVYERLNHFYQGEVMMRYDSRANQGVSIWIECPKR
ncbi:MAG: sensor histidine kinase [Aerococcaceae bacterium]|nr:sensor histidine kinase [Aerococcaceae bacterium]